MVSVSEVVKTWQEGFANKDSSKLGEFFTDDFRFVSNVRDIGKQETLDWTATGEMAIDNIEVIYENDEVAVIHHDANRGDNKGVAMVVYLKRDGKISSCRVVRTAI
ncbi:nuclear transport factor 2 family protein [SAR202 cluster bacterium AD-802-F09_MRT_200m]|jgi:ketosteroid isomerase-like protein|nr:nuclear transport factor 2 family protein [SAR202 cluster bacterium AD-802-F09_MRT_200m]